MNHSTVAKLLKTHTFANNSTDYTPTFVNGSAREINANDTGVGYYTDTWYGIHNPSNTAITVTAVKTADQGTAGVGVSIRINAGETFYAVISTIRVDAGVTVVLLGIPTTFSR